MRTDKDKYAGLIIHTNGGLYRSIAEGKVLGETEKLDEAKELHESRHRSPAKSD